MWQWPFVLITMRRWEAEGRRMRRGRVWFGRRDGGGGGEGLRVKAKLGGEAWGLVGEKGWRLSVVEEGLGSCGGQGSGRDWSVRIGRSRLRSWSFGRGRVDDFGFVREGKWKTWSHILHYTDVLRVPVGPQIMMEIHQNYSSKNVHWLRGKTYQWLRHQYTNYVFTEREQVFLSDQHRKVSYNWDWGSSRFFFFFSPMYEDSSLCPCWRKHKQSMMIIIHDCVYSNFKLVFI